MRILLAERLDVLQAEQRHDVHLDGLAVLGVQEVLGLLELGVELDAVAFGQLGEHVDGLVVLFVGQVPEDGLVDEPLEQDRDHHGRRHERLQELPRAEALRQPRQQQLEQAYDQVKEHAVEGAKVHREHLDYGRQERRLNSLFAKRIHYNIILFFVNMEGICKTRFLALAFLINML